MGESKFHSSFVPRNRSQHEHLIRHHVAISISHVQALKHTSMELADCTIDVGAIDVDFVDAAAASSLTGLADASDVVSAVMNLGQWYASIFDAHTPAHRLHIALAHIACPAHDAV